MKFRIITALILASLSCHFANAQTIVDFEDLSLPSGGVLFAGVTMADATYTSHGAGFNSDWNETFNCCSSAWSISNHTDLTTPGFTNQYSAFGPAPGGGAGGSSQFGIANNFFQGHATVALPEATTVQGGYFNNTTYVYRAIVDGFDDLDLSGNPTTSFVSGPFSNGDFFRLDIIGKDASNAETGTVEFYLADFRNGGSTAIDDWTWVDLTSLGNNVVSLEFDLTTTDVGMFGPNTPGYFALDNLTLGQANANVPEPASIVCAAICFLFAIVSFRLTRRRTKAA